MKGSAFSRVGLLNSKQAARSSEKSLFPIFILGFDLVAADAMRDDILSSSPLSSRYRPPSAPSATCLSGYPPSVQMQQKVQLSLACLPGRRRLNVMEKG